MVSIGNQHDMAVNVWNWKSNSKVAANKVSSKVSALCFDESGKHFVTVGVRHVKFWYVEGSTSVKGVRNSSFLFFIRKSRFFFFTDFASVWIWIGFREFLKTFFEWKVCFVLWMEVKKNSLWNDLPMRQQKFISFGMLRKFFLKFLLMKFGLFSDARKCCSAARPIGDLIRSAE